MSLREESHLKKLGKIFVCDGAIRLVFAEYFFIKCHLVDLCSQMQTLHIMIVCLHFIFLRYDVKDSRPNRLPPLKGPEVRYVQNASTYS